MGSGPASTGPPPPFVSSLPPSYDPVIHAIGWIANLERRHEWEHGRGQTEHDRMRELLRVELKHRDRRVGHEHLEAHRPSHWGTTAPGIGHELRLQVNAPGADEAIEA